MTRRVALIGKPLRRRHSQVMHDAAFAAAGIDARYELLELEPEAVEGAVRGRARARLARPRGHGAVQAAGRRARATRSRPTPRRSGPSTTSREPRAGRLIGFNTDAPGFRAGVELAMGRPLAGADVVVAGAGGAAHAVVFACLSAGRAPGDDRQPDGCVRRRARASASPTSGRGPSRRWRWTTPPSRRRFASADLAVNATTVGMLEPGTTIDVELLPPGATVFDLVYVPPETPLLRAARARGLRAANGSEMLIQQAAIAFERWTGVGGMADVMRAAVAPLLADASGARLTDALRDDRRGRAPVGRGRCATRASCRSPCRTAGLGSLRGIAASGADGLRARSRLGRRASRSGRTGRSTTSSSGRPCRTRARSTRSGSTTARRASRPTPARSGRSSTARLPSVGRRARRGRDLGSRADRQRRCRGRSSGSSSASRPWRVAPEDAMRHVFGYTCVNDISSRDPWLDGDQWLLGKSMAGFCPVGPWVVTRRRAGARRTCGSAARSTASPIQDGTHRRRCASRSPR